jgi:CRP-like cAMP-binding protein
LIVTAKRPRNVTKGDARVVRGDELLSTLGPGAFFGEWASLVAGPGYALSRKASVIADSVVTVAVVAGEQFAEFYSTIPMSANVSMRR